MTHRSIVILDAAVLGPMRRSLGRTFLSVLAIALGVALGFAVYLINRAATDEVSRAARSLFGVADLAVEAGPAGLDEMLYPLIARLDGIEVASPVVEVSAKLAGRRGTLSVLGVDGFRARHLQASLAHLAGGMSGAIGSLDPQALFLSSSAANELDLQQDDALNLQVGLDVITFRVAAVLPAQALEQRAALMDIATAQWKFASLGKLTRVNLRLKSGASEQQVRAALRSILPGDARVVTPGEATSDALRMSSAYRSNLTALALVALFTGGFLVYSTQTLAVLRRRREFALMHALGMTNRQQICCSLLSGSVIGVAGAIAGLLLGLIAAQYALASLGGADLGAGYFRAGSARLQVSALELLIFALLGAGTAVVGTLRPALDTAQIPTAAALKAGDIASGRTPSHAALSLLLLACSACALLLPPLGSLPLPGYVSIALLILASVTAIATVMRAVLARLPRSRTVPFQIAIAHLTGTARYVTLSVAAIVVSFSLMVAMLIMVTSFRNSLDAWTQKILPADLYLRAGYTSQTAFFDAATIERMRSLPGVQRMDTGRFSQLSLAADRPAVVLVARSFDAATIEEALWIEKRTDELPPAGTIPVWVSEAAADLYRWSPGAVVSLPIAGRQVAASVRGLWRDYEHQNGAILMERNAYVELTGDTAVNAVSLWARNEAAIPEISQSIRKLIPPGADFELRLPRELRAMSLAVFDRTFAVTYLLEIVAVIIGLLGISASTSAQVLARRGEFGVLRYIGLTRRQIAATLAIEGLLLGSVGVLVGVITGGAVSVILIYVVNRQSFHWSMDVFVPWVALMGLSVIVAGCSALIAVISGRRAMSGEVISAVKEDW